MGQRLAQKTALVTGGSSGIGRAIAIAFAREGADLVITYKNRRQGAAEVAEEARALGRKCEVLHADFGHDGQVTQLLERALSQVAEIDVLVNNVGVLTRSPFLEIDPEQLQRVFQTNLFTPFILIQHLCRRLIEKKRRGSIINISSLSATRATSRVAHYQSSKAALDMLSRSVAYEMAPHGIRVNTISPGLTQTSANRSQWEESPTVWAERMRHIPNGRAGLPEDHAGAAVFLASDESSWVTGANIVIDGGQSTA